MTGSDAGRDGGRVHWLVAGQFSAEPRGRTHRLTSQEFGTALATILSTIRVSVTDRFGNGETRELELKATTLGALTLTGVVRAVPQLQELAALASRGLLPERDRLVAEVERIVGPGRLARACAAEFASGTTPVTELGPAAPAPSSGAPGAEIVDAILDKSSKVSTAAQAVSAFAGAVGKTRQGGTAAGTVAPKVRAVLETAIRETAEEILASDLVRRLEANWRGLHLLLTQCPPSAGFRVELLDVTPDGLAAALRARPDEGSLDDPDAVFVTEPVETLPLLSEIAEIAEASYAPCVATVTPTLLGDLDLDELSASFDRLPPDRKEAWTSLRAGESSRWLCLAANRVVLFTEGPDAAARVVLGSPVWALATMLSVSYRAQGAFARIVGQPGAYRCGATRILREGPGEGVSIPTERLVSLDTQRALADLGIVGLGSPRNSDQLTLDRASMVSSAADAWPLPGQILTGRIVRFSRWVRGQIAPGSTAREASAFFDQTASALLFPGLERVARATATLADTPEGRALRVVADVVASHAGRRIHVEFSLPA